MPTPLIRGSLIPQLQRTKIRYDPGQSVTTTREYEGAGATSCWGMTTEAVQKGAAYDYDSMPGKSKLIITESINTFLPDTAVTSARWELLTNQQQLDIFEHPNVSSMAMTELAQVRKDVKKHESGAAVSGSGYTDQQTALFNLLIRGTTHYMVPQWVLRYTATVSNQYSIFGVDSGGVGSVFLTSELGVTGRIRSIIQSIPDEGGGGTVWGWLKMSVTESEGANNTVNQSSEFWLAAWPTLLYS